MQRPRQTSTVTGILAGGAFLAAAGLLLAPPAAGAQGTGQVKGDVGRFFFSPSGGSDRGPDRWGVPRLDALRDDDRAGRRHRVNVRTIAGEEPVFEKPDRRRPHHTRKRRRVRRPLRSTYPTVIQVRRVEVREEGEGARKKAIRRSDVVRNRKRSETAANESGEPAPPPGAEAPAPDSAPEDEPAGGAARGGGTGPPLLLVPPDPDAEGGTPARDCALVKVRTPEGIAWSHRVSLDALGVSSISGAASTLRSEIGRGATLVFRSGEGELSVPGARVESLMVGPCR